jgi:hypothetical protein
MQESDSGNELSTQICAESELQGPSERTCLPVPVISPFMEIRKNSRSSCDLIGLKNTTRRVAIKRICGLLLYAWIFENQCALIRMILHPRTRQRHYKPGNSTAFNTTQPVAVTVEPC